MGYVPTESFKDFNLINVVYAVNSLPCTTIFEESQNNPIRLCADIL
jgi:hypothetical protein